LATLAATLLVLPVAPASADTRVLCKGFSQCSSMGYGNLGYHRSFEEMWWRMYAGHNCTNYAAYRMVKAGLPNVRPWSGSGNASNWGIALSGKTDQTPMVGAIAWWRDRGHVQYVERVLAADRIIVSEDHWGGDFNWAEIRKGDGSNWPDGFIHLRDAQVRNLTQPTISGDVRVGQPLVATAGSWRPLGRLEAQWLRDGAPISGATGWSYTPVAADLGKRLSIAVVAHRYGYIDATRTSAATAVVAPGSFTVIQTPTIGGYAKVTGTLTAGSPQLTPKPRFQSLQWLADGQPLSGATSTTLVLGPELEGRRITLAVTLSRPGYAPKTVLSEPTEAVGPEKIEATIGRKLLGSPIYGETLRLEPGRVNVVGATRQILWLRDGVPFANDSLYYAPSLTDIGRRIAAEVIYSKPGYAPVTSRLSTAHVVRSRPAIAISSPRARRVAVTLRAPGVATVVGWVTLTDGTHAATRWLDNGRTAFGPRWIHSGRQRLTVVYLGSHRVEKTQRTAWVAVR
jgi:hypothetical protein